MPSLREPIEGKRLEILDLLEEGSMTTAQLSRAIKVDWGETLWLVRKLANTGYIRANFESWELNRPPKPIGEGK